MTAAASIAQWTAFLGSVTALLGAAGYGLRVLVRVVRTIDGHIDTMRENTAATVKLTSRVDALEQTVKQNGATTTARA